MKTLQRNSLSLAVVAALATSGALADDTASGIRGVILGPNGDAVSDATIEIVYEPTGRTTTLKTNDKGNFNASGLRVGGPYSVRIDTDSYEDAELNDVYLKLGETLRLNHMLDGAQLEELYVTAQATNYSNNGSESNFGPEAIETSPTANRDLKEILRMNPLVNIGSGGDAPMSIAGMNPRYNSFSVDGVAQNDDFGLNSNGYPTQRSPISLEAVEQVSVSATPFGVTNGRFSGGQVNAVTKSGTNDFSGSVFYEFSNDSMAGTPVNPETGEDIEGAEFDETTWGASLGGPIIKDTLFFFASYETYDSSSPVEWGPSGSGITNETFATEDAYNEVVRIAQNVYGVSAGGYNIAPTESDDKILLKLDWNINDAHRLAATYQHTEGNVTRNQTSSNSELRLSSHWYDKEETLETFSVHLYSDWTDNFSTEIKISDKSVETIQAPSDKSYGDITVYTSVFNDQPSNRIAFGPDQYRHGNELGNDTFNIRFVGEYLLGDHALTFGFDHDTIDVFNLFAPNSLGRWEFDSLEDFENRTASEFYYDNAYSNVVNDAAAEFTFGSTALFIEDSWAITQDFELTAGLRYERISNGDSPAYNANFEERYGFSNAQNLDGVDILLPRISFVWDALDSTRVRGGIGRFSGGRPNVWLSNAYSNDGVTYTTFDRGAVDSADYLTNVDITNVPDSVKANMVEGDGNVNVTDPNFELPSDYRTNVAVDYTFDLPGLGDGFIWTNEFLYIERENDVQWVDLTRQEVGVTADGGRKIYEPIDNLTGEITDRYDLMLTNADESGDSKIFSTALSKAWDNGLSLNASYTHQDITEGNPGLSSTATSNIPVCANLKPQRSLCGSSGLRNRASFCDQPSVQQSVFLALRHQHQPLLRA